MSQFPNLTETIKSDDIVSLEMIARQETQFYSDHTVAQLRSTIKERKSYLKENKATNHSDDYLALVAEYNSATLALNYRTGKIVPAANNMSSSSVKSLSQLQY